MPRVLIIGATSSIAEATAREYAARGAALFLVGRNAVRLGQIATDLKVRGAADAQVYRLDCNEIAAHAAMLDSAWEALGEIDVALIAHGTLPAQADCDGDLGIALREFCTNGTSTIALCHALALRLTRGSTLAVISSVAGDRGRASNYLYGSAKAAVSAYASGLGQRLRPLGVDVVVIKPGFVDTPMTRGFRKGVLWATPDAVALGIVRACDHRRPVAYLPWFWLGVMHVIRNIPERIFRRLSL